MTKRSVTKKPKLTQWFDGSIKPARDGVYERDCTRPIGIRSTAFWLFKEGKWKHGGFDRPDQVFLNANRDAPDQDLSWRGLAQNPEVQP